MKSKILITDEPAFDDYLSRLDALLIGSAEVRALSLAEVADHLLEHRDMLLEEGTDHAQAVDNALDEFGTAKDFASAQRASMFGRFWRLAIGSGLGFAVLMSVTQLADGRMLPTWLFLLQGAFFGPALSAFLVYRMPSRRSDDDFVARAFVVGYPRRLQWLMRAFFAAFAVQGLLGLAAGIGYDFIGLTPAAGLLSAGVVAFVLTSLWRVLETIEVNPDGLQITRLHATKSVRWDQVRQISRRTRGRPWLYKFYWGRVLDVTCVDDEGKLVEFTVFPDALNASRLQFELERRLGASA